MRCNPGGPTKDIPIMVDVVYCGNFQVYMLGYAVYGHVRLPETIVLGK